MIDRLIELKRLIRGLKTVGNQINMRHALRDKKGILKFIK